MKKRISKKNEAYIKCWLERTNGTALRIFRIAGDGEITAVTLIKENGKEAFEFEVKKINSFQTTGYKQLLPSTKTEFDNAMKKATDYFTT